MMAQYVFAVATFLLSGAASLSAAELRLARLFSDHAVLQRDHQIPIWGWCDPGQTVQATLAGQNATAVADAQGRFEVRFTSLPAGGPHQMTVRCGELREVREDILIGEVWIAGGQSNMLFALDKSSGGAEVIADANNFPQLRLFHALYHPAKEPAADVYQRADRFVNGEWKTSDTKAVSEFSAVAYHFGRNLQRELTVPVGIIQSCWHSTPIEPWVPPTVLSEKFPDIVSQWAALERNFDPQANRDVLHKALIAQWEKDRDTAVASGTPVPPWPNKPPDQATLERDYPGRLFNGMIEPLIPFAVRGVIWYQGESSAWQSWRYRELFPAMIRGWRARWIEDLPFLAVELAGWHGNKTGPSEAVESKEPLPSLREAQRVSADLVPGLWLASAVDLYDHENPKDIHPHDKASVAQRLALLARRHLYGEATLVATGPRYEKHSSRAHEITITFTEIGSGLALRSGTVPIGFAIAGADGRYVAATARLQGNTIVVSSPDVPRPVDVAYDWAAVPTGNLINNEGLPTSAFRTDQGKRHSQP